MLSTGKRFGMLTVGGSDSLSSEWVFRRALKEGEGEFLECRKPEVLIWLSFFSLQITKL